MYQVEINFELKFCTYIITIVECLFTNSNFKIKTHDILCISIMLFIITSYDL